MTDIKSAFWSTVAKMQPRDGSRRITAAEAREKVDAGEAILLDIRELPEIRGGMAEKAVWVPTSAIEREGPAWQEFLASASKDKQVVVYCAAGMRAERVCERLAALGFRVANLGGFKDWAGAGMPVRIPS